MENPPCITRQITTPTPRIPRYITTPTKTNIVVQTQRPKDGECEGLRRATSLTYIAGEVALQQKQDAEILSELKNQLNQHETALGKQKLIHRKLTAEKLLLEKKLIITKEEATQRKNEIIDSTADFMEEIKLKSRLEEQIRLQKFNESNFDRELKLQNSKMENHIREVSKVKSNTEDSLAVKSIKLEIVGLGEKISAYATTKEVKEDEILRGINELADEKIRLDQMLDEKKKGNKEWGRKIQKIRQEGDIIGNRMKAQKLLLRNRVRKAKQRRTELLREAEDLRKQIQNVDD